MAFLYNIFLATYVTGVRVASLWNPKAKAWLAGRKDFFAKQYSFHPGDGKTIWMHAASLGEFEQGRPVLKLIGEKFPESIFIITFFSPSGYQIASKDPDFKNILYLPIDSRKNARKLLDLIRPDIVLWVKYEFWRYYLEEINRRKIPILLISGAFRKTQPFFKSYGKFWRKLLAQFDHFFLQNPASAELVIDIVGNEKITVSGDTRCDRVINVADNFSEISAIANFCGDAQVVVAGSTWEDDEAEWVHFVKQHPKIKFIFAPHEVDEENIRDVMREFPGAITYSSIAQQSSKPGDNSNCLVIDNIGMLSKLYKYATITYVGGGFGYDGLHNILEAAVYGKPVIFGPEYEKNFEAAELIDAGGGFTITNAIELEKIAAKLLSNDEMRERSGNAARSYILQNAGASEKIVAYLEKRNLLGN